MVNRPNCVKICNTVYILLNHYIPVLNITIFFADFVSPITAAQTVLHSVCKKRKDVLPKTMDLLLSIVQNPVHTPSQKDGKQICWFKLVQTCLNLSKLNWIFSWVLCKTLCTPHRKKMVSHFRIYLNLSKLVWKRPKLKKMITKFI